MADVYDFGFYEILGKMDKIARNIKGMAIEAVDEAAPIVEESFKRHIEAAADGGYATGALKNSVMRTKAKENKYGVYAVVKVTGTAKTGITREDQLHYLDTGVWHGREKTYRQRPRPVRDPTIVSCAPKVQHLMEESVRERIMEVWDDKWA